MNIVKNIVIVIFRLILVVIAFAISLSLLMFFWHLITLVPNETLEVILTFAMIAGTMISAFYICLGGLGSVLWAFSPEEPFNSILY